MGLLRKRRPPEQERNPELHSAPRPEDSDAAAVSAERRARFDASLVEHRIDEAVLIALAYARDLTGSRSRARELVSRARSRLWENCSWDPASGTPLPVLLWLDLSLQGFEDPAEMARITGRDVKHFYRAVDRRKRHVQRLLAAKRKGRKEDEETA